MDYQTTVVKYSKAIAVTAQEMVRTRATPPTLVALLSTTAVESSIGSVCVQETLAHVSSSLRPQLLSLICGLSGCPCSGHPSPQEVSFHEKASREDLKVTEMWA